MGVGVGRPIGGVEVIDFSFRVGICWRFCCSEGRGTFGGGGGGHLACTGVWKKGHIWAVLILWEVVYRAGSSGFLVM